MKELLTWQISIQIVHTTCPLLARGESFSPFSSFSFSSFLSSPPSPPLLPPAHLSNPSQDCTICQLSGDRTQCVGWALPCKLSTRLIDSFRIPHIGGLIGFQICWDKYSPLTALQTLYQVEEEEAGSLVLPKPLCEGWLVH